MKLARCFIGFIVVVCAFRFLRSFTKRWLEANSQTVEPAICLYGSKTLHCYKICPCPCLWCHVTPWFKKKELVSFLFKTSHRVEGLQPLVGPTVNYIVLQ